MEYIYDIYRKPKRSSDDNYLFYDERIVVGDVGPSGTEALEMARTVVYNLSETSSDYLYQVRNFRKL